MKRERLIAIITILISVFSKLIIAGIIISSAAFLNLKAFAVSYISQEVVVKCT